MTTKQTYFVTGISTEVGKTIVSAILTEALEADYWKPIQAGDLEFSDRDKISDLLTNTKSVVHPNVYALHTPMSPHKAAEIDGVEIKASLIQIPETDNHLIIEGAGGLLVPISETETILDLIQPSYSVILVSRHYLGSINHTLMSIEILRNRGFEPQLIFVGNKHESTESIIQSMTGVAVIGRVNEEKEINAEVVKHYANQFKHKL